MQILYSVSLFKYTLDHINNNSHTLDWGPILTVNISSKVVVKFRCGVGLKYGHAE